MLKEELRKTIRNRKRQFTSTQLDELSLAAVSKVLKHPRFCNANTVMLYCSLPDEVSTRLIIKESSAKTIVLPRVTGPGTMELRLYTGTQSLEEGAFHIMEPTGPIFTKYQDIELAIIPGMAFDAQGHRMGRGRGYYDRFLPLLTNAYKIGICFPFQHVENVPTEPTDINMDEVIF